MQVVGDDACIKNSCELADSEEVQHGAVKEADVCGMSQQE